MNREDSSFRLDIWHRELDFSIDSSWTNEGWVESLNLICCEDYFYIRFRVKSIKLIKQLQHRSLNFFLATRVCIISLSSDRINFIDEYNCRSMSLSCFKDLSYKSWSLAEIFLDQFRACYSEKSCRCLICLYTVHILYQIILQQPLLAKFCLYLVGHTVSHL